MKYLWLTLLLAGCAHHAAAPVETAPVAKPVTEVKTPTRLHRLVLQPEESVGTTEDGQAIPLGGFSGLRFLGKTEDGLLRFLTLTDRGPNAAEEETGEKTLRPFALPGYQPAVIYLLADPRAGTFRVERKIPLVRPDGKPLSGLPQRPGGETPVDLHGKNLAYDPYGMDPEGIAPAAGGGFWISEEYGPSVARFSAEGKLERVLKPGQGIPKVFEQIRINRGFEGLALSEDRIYAMLQSPLDNPRSAGQKNSKKSRFVRLLELDANDPRTLAQYGYIHGKGDKIGDIAVEAPGQLLVIEQNGKSGKKSVKKLYRFKFANATNLQLLPEKVAGPNGSLELMSEGELAKAGIVPGTKEEVADLSALGMKESKTEGVDLVDAKTVALIVDNDFGLAGDLDKQSGKLEMSGESSALYLLSLGREE